MRKQTYACCHKGNFYEPRVAPDKTLAHAPGCRQAQLGEYVCCSGSCGGFILVTRERDGAAALGYCDSCNPLRMVDVKVPAVVLDALVALRDTLFGKGKKHKQKRTKR